jgi:hypothetical protein
MCKLLEEETEARHRVIKAARACVKGGTEKHIKELIEAVEYMDRKP